MLPIEAPGLFWTIAFVTSFYYGWRGFAIKYHEIPKQDQVERIQQLCQLHPDPAKPVPHDSKTYTKPWCPFEILFIHAIQDAIYNFVCGLAGFVALFIDCVLFRAIPDLSKIQSGTAITIVFFTLLAIVGISGQLPFALFRGIIFGSKA